MPVQTLGIQPHALFGGDREEAGANGADQTPSDDRLSAKSAANPPAPGGFAPMERQEHAYSQLVLSHRRSLWRRTYP